MVTVKNSLSYSITVSKAVIALSPELAITVTGIISVCLKTDLVVLISIDEELRVALDWSSCDDCEFGPGKKRFFIVENPKIMIEIANTKPTTPSRTSFLRVLRVLMIFEDRFSLIGWAG